MEKHSLTDLSKATNLKLKFTINNKKNRESIEGYQKTNFYFKISISCIMERSRQEYKSSNQERASYSSGSSFYSVTGEKPAWKGYKYHINFIRKAPMAY